MRSSNKRTADTTQSKAKNVTVSVCEARGCQAKAVRKIPVKVNGGKIVLNVCDQCAIKFTEAPELAGRH